MRYLYRYSDFTLRSAVNIIFIPKYLILHSTMYKLAISASNCELRNLTERLSQGSVYTRRSVLNFYLRLREYRGIVYNLNLGKDALITRIRYKAHLFFVKFGNYSGFNHTINLFILVRKTL